MTEFTMHEHAAYELAVVGRWLALAASYRAMAEAKMESERAALVIGGAVIGKNETERRAMTDSLMAGHVAIIDALKAAERLLLARQAVATLILGVPTNGLQLHEGTVRALLFADDENPDEAVDALLRLAAGYTLGDRRFLPDDEYGREVADSFGSATWVADQMKPALAVMLMRAHEGVAGWTVEPAEAKQQEAEDDGEYKPPF